MRYIEGVPADPLPHSSKSYMPSTLDPAWPQTRKWDARCTVVQRVDAASEREAQRILSARLAGSGFTVADEPKQYDYEYYEVEVQKEVTTTVRVRAKNALSAAKQVDNMSYPLPPAADWDDVEGWNYTVRGNASGKILYEGDAQELT